MKTSFLLFMLGAIGLVGAQASAADQLFVLRGDQLKSYSYTEIQPRPLRMGATHDEWEEDGTRTHSAFWVKSSSGYTCKANLKKKTALDTSASCYAAVEANMKFMINDFWRMDPHDLTEETRYPDNEDSWRGMPHFLSNQDLAKLRERAEKIAAPTLGNDDRGRFYDVQNSTVYTHNGSCYQFELRIYANPETRQISTYAFNAVAARCP